MSKTRRPVNPTPGAQTSDEMASLGGQVMRGAAAVSDALRHVQRELSHVHDELLRHAAVVRHLQKNVSNAIVHVEKSKHVAGSVVRQKE